MGAHPHAFYARLRARLALALAPRGPGGVPVDQTLVSCLFDLGRREPGRPRSLDDYLRDAAFVLSLELPLVLFTDPEIAPWVEHERAVRGLADKTRVVPLLLETLDTWQRLADVRDLPTFVNGDPKKDTPLFQLMACAKLELIERAIVLDAFDTETFAWIDAGIAHVAVPPIAFPAPADRITLLEMRAIEPRETLDRRAFYSYERGSLAAGFIRGSCTAFRDLLPHFWQEFDAAVAAGIRPSEQQVLSFLNAVDPARFDTYFGDYPSILCNWDFIRRDLETVLYNLSRCERAGMRRHADAILAKIRASKEAIIILHL